MLVHLQELEAIADSLNKNRSTNPNCEQPFPHRNRPVFVDVPKFYKFPQELLLLLFTFKRQICLDGGRYAQLIGRP